MSDAAPIIKHGGAFVSGERGRLFMVLFDELREKQLGGKDTRQSHIIQFAGRG